MTTFSDLTEVPGKVGDLLGHSPWHEITQPQVDKFADATWDHQWIHVDVEKAKEGPYGGTIAHGFLTMSLTPALLAEIWQITGIDMMVNQGMREFKLRAPVPVGSKVRLAATLAAYRARPRDFHELILGLVFEVETADGNVAKAATGDLVLLVHKA